MRPRRRSTALAAVLAVSLVLAACGDGTEDDTDPAGTTATPDDDGLQLPIDDGDEPDDGDDAPDDGTDTTDATDDGTDAETDGTDATPPEDTSPGAPPLEGEASAEDREAEGTAGLLTVTDVRIGRHDGFDRVVFELAGDDGQVGYFTGYVDQPQQQGSGNPVDVAGTSYLEVLVRGIAMPFDRPSGVDAWEEGRLAGPTGSVITEVVDENVFEGQQQFFIGLDGDRFAYRVSRLDGPQRIVIDIVPTL